MIAIFAVMTSKQTKGSGRGGKRDGSGRGKSYTKPVRFTVTLEESEVKQIEDKGHKVPTFIREAAIRRLKDGW